MRHRSLFAARILMACRDAPDRSGGIRALDRFARAKRFRARSVIYLAL
jgi:hypothetical protein